jgi:Na+/H+ antiporter NhaD/arsenite permease-like protein
MKLYARVKHLIKTETVLLISAFVAIVTMFFVKPSLHYISYLDLRVLSLLFCLMAVVAGLNDTGIFIRVSEKLLKKVQNIRSLSFVFISLSFFSSMLITNDVALITFVPFAIMILRMTGQEKYFIPVIVLDTIAANLGSMLTPIGNPQNLYLYNTYYVSMIDFLQITLPYTILSFLLLSITIILMKKETLQLTIINKSEEKKTDNKKRYMLTMYCILFLVCLTCVIRILDYRLTLLIVFVVILIFDRKILRKVDYSLLLTFVCFFIFVGNIGNIPVIRNYLGNLLVSRELTVALIASQIISNVPTAVLLSAFTDNYKALILGTDIGGLGTLVASLASLISYKFYCKTEHAKPGKYLGVFSLYNLVFLVVLCLFYMLTNT